MIKGMPCFEFAKNNFYVYSRGASNVSRFDGNGKFLNTIGKIGKGPYEYLAPSIVKQYNQKVNIWCDKLTKLFVFSLSGEPLEKYNFSHGIKDFVIYNDYVCFYTAGGFDNNIVMLFDLNKRQFLSKGFGTKTKEHKMLNMNACTGGLALDGSNLYFSLTNQPTVYKVRLSDFQVSTKEIKDPGFVNKKVHEEINQLLASPQSAEYIIGSDIINGLFCIDSLLILKAAVGKIEMKGLQLTDISKRRQKLYVLNKNLRVEYSIKSKLNKGCNDCLYSSLGSHLYTLRLKDDFETYILSQMLIHDIQ